MPLYSGWCSLALSHLPKTNGHKDESRIPGVFDQEISSHNNFRRDYKPHLGRYLQNDPIGLKGRVNLYIYSSEDPIMGFDPSGLVTCQGKWE